MSLSLVPKGAEEREFLAVFSRLCVGLRETQDDSGITQQVYFEALRDLSSEALDAGAAALMRERGRKFFPTTAEWRTAAENAHVEALRKALTSTREDPWRHECRECEDSGWVVGMTCDGGAEQWPEHGEPHTNIGPQKGDKDARKMRPWSYKPEPRLTATPRKAVCGRVHPHAPHAYTVACSCRMTNATYRRHQSFGSGAS